MNHDTEDGKAVQAGDAAKVGMTSATTMPSEADDRRFVAVEYHDAKPAAEKPVRVPSRHRHLPVSDSLNPALIEQVLKAVPATSEAELKAGILRRLGYPAPRFDRISRRVDRWKANQAGTGRRMPSHIKGMLATVELVNLAMAEFRKPKEPEPTLTQKVVKGAKKLATDFASEVKAQQA